VGGHSSALGTPQAIGYPTLGSLLLPIPIPWKPPEQDPFPGLHWAHRPYV
jgi:hypothetical protein